MKIYNLTFSPTGGTKKVADIVSQSISENVESFELCLAQKDLKIPSLSKEDICLICVPSFGGRVPGVAAERISEIPSAGAKAVLICVYGNRAYDDTLIELQSIAQKAGFECFAMISALAEHSIAREIAKGRPDKDDEAVLKGFGAKIKEKILMKKFDLESKIPGNPTYKERSKSKFAPETKESCIGCGACVRGCPVSAIDSDNPSSVDGEKCISCLKCTAICPVNAKALNEELQKSIEEKLRKGCSDRKENELFV